MSVVVIREGILYSDTVGIVAPCNYKKKIEKQITDPQGDLVYAFCGDLPRKKDLPNLMQQAREWFQRWYFGADQEGVPDPVELKKFLPDAYFIVAWNDGFISYKYGKLTIHEIDDLIDGGDGGTFAMAALDCGLRGEALERVVNQCNPNSGLGIQETVLTTLPDPINENNIEVGSVESIHVDAPSTDSEWGVVLFDSGNVYYNPLLPIPWRNTQRIEMPFDNQYTEYGFFIPWGYGARLFEEFCETGYCDPQSAGQGSSCGMLISSDGMLYDVSWFGMLLTGLNGSESKPGRFDVRPLGKWHEDIFFVKGNGWNREYIQGCVTAGVHGFDALHKSAERFSSPRVDGYLEVDVGVVIEELRKRNVRPVVKTKIRDGINFAVIARHYKQIERLFTPEMIERYKL